MSHRLFRKILRFFFLVMGSTLISWAISAYYDLTHQRATAAAIDVVQRFDQSHRLNHYREIYNPRYKSMLIMGSGHPRFGEDYGSVDMNERSFRHYYEPLLGLGVPWYDYYLGWLADGAMVSKPLLGRYPGALEWARNGAGSQDLRNWEGALLAYDYSTSSREEAYYRLGHVTHLVADMAEPDHATNTPHGASGYYWPEQASEIFPFFERVVLGAVTIRTRIAEMFTQEAEKAGRWVGFERMIEQQFEPGNRVSIPRLRSKDGRPLVLKRGNLDSYFNEMANISRSTYRKEGFTLPIGLKFWPGSSYEADVVWGTLANFVKGPRKDYCFIPAINLNDRDEKDSYLRLGLDLLSHSVSFNAGLLQFFYDTAAPPPYVKRVVIGQRGSVVYDAVWQGRYRSVSGDHVVAGLQRKPFRYDVLVRRDFATVQNAVLQAHQPAFMEIEFGPLIDGISPSLRRVAVTVGTVPCSQGALNREGSLYRCQFIPEWNPEQRVQPITIEAEALHAPYDGREGTHDLFSQNYSYRKGELDSRPDSPAKVRPRAPYTWMRFEPGPDRWHKVKVALLQSTQSDIIDERPGDPRPVPTAGCDTVPPEDAVHHNRKGTRSDYWTYPGSLTKVGPYREWHDTQRTRLKITGCYDALGRRTGVWTAWRRESGGRPQSQYTYSEGKYHGRFKRWYKNGRVLDTGGYHRGQRSGEYRSFHDNGRRCIVGRYANGKPVGKSVEYHKHTGKVIKVTQHR